MDVNLCRATDLLVMDMPVPPVSIRPSIPDFHGNINEDDLTSVLSSCIKINNKIKQSIERGEPFSKL